MTAQKQPSSPGVKPAQSPAAPASTRKPWKPRTPVEVFLDQAEKLRKQIAEREEELKDLRKQLQKFEEARKVFESA